MFLNRREKYRLGTYMGRFLDRNLAPFSSRSAHCFRLYVQTSGSRIYQKLGKAVTKKWLRSEGEDILKKQKPKGSTTVERAPGASKQQDNEQQSLPS